MDKKLIFAIEDDEDILTLLKTSLTKENFLFEGFNNANSFFESLKSKIPDCIVLDLMLPDIDGFSIIKKLKNSKEYKNIPIIIISAKSDEIDKVVGLELGADDYLTKPFSVKELIVRIKKQIEKISLKNEKEIDFEINKEKTILEKNINKNEEEYSIEINNIKLFLSKTKHSVYVNGEKINLTSAEFKILEKLMSKPGWVISREQLLDYLWGNDKAVIDRTIDVHVTHLRHKLKEAGKLIINERGIGYKLNID
jgi:DNA-binding response OmpR family regulator